MSRPQLVSRPSSAVTESKTIVLVSGGNTGIGFEIVKSLAKLPNYQILMGCRDTNKGEAAAASIGAPLNVNPIQLDITNDESIEHAYLTIAQTFGKLDVLINNAGTAGNDLGPDASIREVGAHVFNINVTSTKVLTDKLVPLLEKSRLPRIIFINSTVGSVGNAMNIDGMIGPMMQYQLYCSSKVAENFLVVTYARKYPQWKVNAVCPGHRATGLNNLEKNEHTDPALGAVRVTELVQEGVDGPTCTFSDSKGPVPW